MSELVAPRVVGEEEVLFIGRRVIKRRFQYPHGIEEWVLTGGRGAPAIIFPVTTEGEVVALRQFRHAPNRFLLELPGGNPEAIEKSEGVARMELVKETGFTTDKFEVIGDGIWFDPASSLTPFLPVLATGCHKVGKPEPERTEILEVEIFSVSDWIRKIYSGEVCDSKSITTTYLAMRKLGYKLVGPQGDIL